MVLGVLTLDYRIPNLSEKRKEVSPGILDARYEVRLHHEIGKVISKRRYASVHEEWYGAIGLASVKEKAGACMCVVCWGYTTHVEGMEKEKFCMCDRFSADGFRTRAARVIRRRVLGFGGQMEKPGKREGGRPGDSWALGKRCVCVGVRSVSAGRGPEGRFTF